MISQITQTQPKTLTKRTITNTNNSSNPSFKGPVDFVAQGVTQALNFLNTSPAIGACFVDFGFMVTPRTVVDFTRSVDAGVETGIRESSGTINHATAGAVGLGAGYLVSSAFNKANGVKAHRIFMDGNAIDTFKNFITASETPTGYDVEKYWKTFFNKLEYFNTTNGGKAWTKLNEHPDLVNKATKILVNTGVTDYRVPKEALAKLAEEITGTTGASSTFRILGTEVEGSIKDLTGNANSLFKAVKDKVAHDKTTLVNDLEKFLKGIKNKKVATVAAGLSVPVAIGMSVQPINRYLTKKRTGSEGFVGVEGREPDKTNKFKLLKLLVGLAMGTGMIACILKKPQDLYTKTGSALQEIQSKLQYKGMVPTLDQFKFIYGMTIMSRIFACRDKNELRESSIKDTLGFANWLILGGFVSKLSAKAFNKELINYDEAKHGKGIMKFIANAVEKTHEEILYPVLKKAGISTTENGKVIPFRKLMKAVKNIVKENGQHADIAKKALTQLKYKNFAQMLGYIYSGVVLGWGIPKLNIYITNKVENKNKKQPTPNTISTEFIPKINGNGSKTFGAFYNAM